MPAVWVPGSVKRPSLRPKPMVEIGGRPILWHIMKTYSHYGINDFIVCLGYKGYLIKEYFSNYYLHASDVTIDILNNKVEMHRNTSEPWRITLVDTGADTMTGGRLKRVSALCEGRRDLLLHLWRRRLERRHFGALLAFHKSHGRMVTLTATRPTSRFGALDIADDGAVTQFTEKPPGEGRWINGGYFVLSPKVGDYIDDDTMPWEREPMETLAREGQVAAYKHDGFWQPMDTLHDKNLLEGCGTAAARPGRSGSHAGNAGSGQARASFSPATPASREAGLRCGCSISARTSPATRSIRPPIPASSTRPMSPPACTPSSATCATPRSSPRSCNPRSRRSSSISPRSRSSATPTPTPIGTYETNVLGTIHLLEAVRKTPSVRAVVVVTTDKCYENKEWIWPYRETDPLGGYDPYSSSKACAEIVTSSWRDSFFNPAHIRRASRSPSPPPAPATSSAAATGPPIASSPTSCAPSPAARRSRSAIPPPRGPGSTCSSRCAAISRSQKSSTQTASAMLRPGTSVPEYTDARPVEWIVRYLSAKWGSGRTGSSMRSEHVHEAQMLKLDWSKAHAALGWQPVLPLPEALDYTLDWYQREAAGVRARELCLEQIVSYSEKAFSS